MTFFPKIIKQLTESAFVIFLNSSARALAEASANSSSNVSCSCTIDQSVSLKRMALADVSNWDRAWVKQPSTLSAKL
jgi:hypothetical protein